MKAIVIIVFSFSCCLFLNRYVNLCTTACAPMGYPISWATICFVAGCFLGYKMVKR